MFTHLLIEKQHKLSLNSHSGGHSMEAKQKQKSRARLQLPEETP